MIRRVRGNAGELQRKNWEAIICSVQNQKERGNFWFVGVERQERKMKSLSGAKKRFGGYFVGDLTWDAGE